MISFDKLGAQIWDAFPFSVVVTDYVAEPKQRKIVYVNPAFIQLTGFAAQKAVGKPVTLLDGPESDAIRSAECEATLKNSKTYEATFLHHRKDGTEYLSRATEAPLIEPDGSVKFLMLLEMMVSSIEQSALSKESPYAGTLVPLTLPMALREYPSATMPKHLASHPELDALRDLWTTTCKDGALPQRLEFDLGMV
jgi:PAS domain S-box-containing protein